LKEVCDRFKKLEEHIKKLDHKEGALIEVLHFAQDYYGYIGEEVQEFIAAKMKIPRSKVYGVITFYSYFDTEPKGEHVISVCTGTACFVRGADRILEEFKNKLNINVGETTADGKFTLNTLRCLGACGLAPVVSVGDTFYGRFKKEDIGKLIIELSEGRDGKN